MRSDKQIVSRRGQVLIVFAGSLLVLCMLAALACDVGHLIRSRARLQNSADAASLAALLELWEQRGAGATEDDAQAAAEQEARRIVQENYSASDAEVTFGYWMDGSFSADTSGSGSGPAIVVNAVRVEAFRGSSTAGGATPTVFARVMGIERVEQGALATARYKHPGLIPLTVYEPDVPQAGQLFTIYNDSSTAPGNCGLLNFDGGSTDTVEAKEWFYNGYHGSFSVDPDSGLIDCSGTTGLKSALKQPINHHIAEGSVLVACVYRTVSGVGAGASYEIAGFSAIVIEDIQLDSQGDEIETVTARLQSKYIPGTGDTDGTMRDFMLLQLME